ncbi:MAG: hypothetical protein WBY88_13820 [Desulfosarcina sp.]
MSSQIRKLSTRLIRKGALIEETYTAFREWDLSLSIKDNIHTIRKGNRVGDRFMKWVHDNRWKFPETDRVPITKNGKSYDQFPDHDGLSDFDNSDRKFVAVANAHHAKPPILQATDSKWWGWKDALDEVGVSVHFLCPDYIKGKYLEKMSR